MRKKDIKEYVEHSMKLKRQTCIEDIVNYLNAEYKNATVRYEDEHFIIDGDEEDSQKMKESIEEMLGFARKKMKTEK